jgi:hypothetical protein
MRKLEHVMSEASLVAALQSLVSARRAVEQLCQCALADTHLQKQLALEQKRFLFQKPHACCRTKGARG